VIRITSGGGTNGNSYQWQDSIPGGSWTDIAGAIQDTFVTPTLNTGTYYYRANITQSGGCFVVSTAAVVNVVDDPTVTVTVDDDQICDGGSAELTANVTGGVGASSFQWQQYDELFGWQNMLGEDNMVLNTPQLF
jgi:hypothetical protein